MSTSVHDGQTRLHVGSGWTDFLRLMQSVEWLANQDVFYLGQESRFVLPTAPPRPDACKGV